MGMKRVTHDRWKTLKKEKIELNLPIHSRFLLTVSSICNCCTFVTTFGLHWRDIEYKISSIDTNSRWFKRSAALPSSWITESAYLKKRSNVRKGIECSHLIREIYLVVQGRDIIEYVWSVHEWRKGETLTHVQMCFRNSDLATSSYQFTFFHTKLMYFTRDRLGEKCFVIWTFSEKKNKRSESEV